MFLFSLVSVPPQGADISIPGQPLTSGRSYMIKCRVWGSNPPGRVEWFRGFRGLPARPEASYNQSVSADGNVTTSYLRYSPAPEHHGQTLTCRGVNGEMMSSQTVEDTVTLDIFCESTFLNLLPAEEDNFDNFQTYFVWQLFFYSDTFFYLFFFVSSLECH